METHHPHHITHKKKWTEYLLEFLMLFLAVFLGFIAENIREHNVEMQRAKVLAKNLYKEIYNDSIAVQERILVRDRKEKECVYFIDYVKDSNLVKLSSRFYSAFSWAFIQSQQILFDPNDGILNQLRNSGELRYFKNSELQSVIGQLTVMIANIRNRNEREYSFIEDYLRPFTLKYYDFEWYGTVSQHGNLTLFDALKADTTLVTGKIVNLDKFNRKEAENTCSYYLLMLRSTRKTQYTDYAKINHQLLQKLREEFKME
ncbi:MAG TPA: hypothetical protein VMY77_15855 [Chitinophagaceae bacterium]|nr:hypothetical protein [Chitinophagaceae bacterium]